MMHRTLALAACSVFLVGLVHAQLPTPTPTLHVDADLDVHAGVWRLELMGPAQAEAQLRFNAISCQRGGAAALTLPVTFDSGGNAVVEIALADVASICQGQVVVGVDLHLPEDGPWGGVTSALQVLECRKLPVPAFGLFDPLFSQTWLQPDAQGVLVEAQIGTFLHGTDPLSGLPLQYVFYSAPFSLWHVTTGIEGLLPVN